MQTMKRVYNSLFVAFTAMLAMGSLTSCEDYLDKDPDSDVNPTEAFKNFTNFQGFVEQMYNCVPQKLTCYWNAPFNWGEDEILSANNAEIYVTPHVDKGDFKAYYTSWGGNLSFLYGSSDPQASGDGARFQHHTWNDAWYCIRKANLGLANMDLMVDATKEERDAIRGQLLFFRGWWYEELMVWFGGMPYLERVPDASEVLRDERLSFQECAKKAAADFAEAAKYLPENWDKSKVGAATVNNNGIRITRATALAYAGKMMLWAASPLSENGAQVGGALTYAYNTELAEKAAEYLGQVITEVEAGKTPYALCDYYDATEHKPIYDHDRSAVSGNCFSNIFYTVKDGNRQPGSVEAMMRGSQFGNLDDARWGFCTNWGSNIESLYNGSFQCMPTANYVNYAYGMANGLPLDDPDSGFDPTHPFKNRDPRFYHDIVFDGEIYVNGTTEGTKFANQKIASLYTGGLMRDITSASRTGYFCQKLVPHTGNQIDCMAEPWQNGYKAYLPYMRLADVYLMYAEAGAAVKDGGASYHSTTCSKTAEDAINTLRDRVGVDHVNAKFTGDKKKFMDEVRRERACELAFEGFRFNDLQRWLLLTEAPYTYKKSQEFDRVSPDSFYNPNGKYDPREAEVKNWREETILVRNFGTKHYWFPIVEKETMIYEDFPQNPGW